MLNRSSIYLYTFLLLLFTKYIVKKIKIWQPINFSNVIKELYCVCVISKLIMNLINSFFYVLFIHSVIFYFLFFLLRKNWCSDEFFTFTLYRSLTCHNIITNSSKINYYIDFFNHYFFIRSPSHSSCCIINAIIIIDYFMIVLFVS